ncbi:hypothetical protein MAR_000903, partial [Mya arenaria]
TEVWQGITKCKKELKQTTLEQFFKVNKGQKANSFATECSYSGTSLQSHDPADTVIDQQHGWSSKPSLETKENTHTFPIGTVVWGMFGRGKWWSALVIDGAMVGKTTKPGFYWVYWLSDDKISQLKPSCVEPIHKEFQTRCRQNSGIKLMRCGIQR